MRYLSGPQMQRAYERSKAEFQCATCGKRQFLENGIIDYSDGTATVSASCMRDHGRTIISLSEKGIEYVGRVDSLNPLEE